MRTRAARTVALASFGVLVGAFAPFAADGVLRPGIPLIRGSVAAFVVIAVVAVAVVRPASMTEAVGLFLVGSVAFVVGFALAFYVALGPAGSDVVAPPPPSAVDPVARNIEAVFLAPARTTIWKAAAAT